MNWTRSSCFQKSALALLALALVATGAVWAQTPGQYPTSFSNDGVRQTAAGGWVMPYDECNVDSELASFATEVACEAAGWNWDPQALTGSTCFYNRPQCLARIFYGEPVTAGAPPIPDLTGNFDTQPECEAQGMEWRSGSSSSNGACSDGESRSKTDCEAIPAYWYKNACRAKFVWQTSPYVYGDATLNNYNDCTRCHNTRHYPKATEEHHYHGSERSVGETYAMTGHKNMQRPVAPDGLDPHYLSDAPWLDKTGAVITEDIFGQPINFPDATVETGPGVFADLWYLRDWIAPAPEPIYTGGEADGCARCHSTGFDAAYVETTNPPTKQPYIMFPDFPVDQATGGWDQWGIQCSRCHGSRLISDASGIAPLKGDMRHHPDIAPNKAAIGGSYANSEFCVADGLTWAEFGSTKRCYNPAIASSGACTTATGTWDSTNSVCYFSMLASGATRSNLCADCHISGTSDPAGQQRVGSQHGLELDFTGHFHANQFLNSPHARFGGTGTQIGDKTKYDTHFQFEGESYPYSNTVRNKGLAGGCTQCHDVHKSSLAEANPDGGFIHEECTECHAKSLATMFHPGGKGTPLEEMGVNPNAACESCHMPKTEDGRAFHFFRVNVDPSYEMFPSTMFNIPTPSSSSTFANAADDDGYAKAVWIDLDHACGQCHGGGTEHKVTSGAIAAGSNLLTVPDATGFVKGERVVVEGAGADGGELLTWVSSADLGTDIVTLVPIPLAATTVAGAEVVMNPTTNGAGYISKAQLAVLATGIHGDASVANFTYTLGNPNTLQVNFSAASSSCSGSSANCNIFDWNFGDGSPNGTGIAPSHTYAVGGMYTVTLTVTQYGFQSGTKTKSVTTYTADLPPTISASCVFDANSWLMTVTDTGSSDENAVTQGVVEWGDGSLKSTDFSAPFGPFTHTYANAGSFVATYKIADSVGQVATTTCFATPNTFTIGGGVDMVDGTTGLGGVTIKLLKGAAVIKTVYTDVAGNFLASNLKPGSYTLLVTKSGWTFEDPGVIAVGPSNTTLDIDALSSAAPVKGRSKTTSSRTPASSNR